MRAARQNLRDIPSRTRGVLTRGARRCSAHRSAPTLRWLSYNRAARPLARSRAGIGFAYGGLYPGRLHAKGKLVEKHQVHFSVAKCGDYLLYISLHGQHSSGDSHVPGSPFTLHVAPGRAHPLTTQIAPADLPLKAAPEVPKTDKDGEPIARLPEPDHD